MARRSRSSAPAWTRATVTSAPTSTRSWTRPASSPNTWSTKPLRLDFWNRAARSSIEFVRGTDVGHEDSRGDLLGYVEVRVRGTDVASLLVDDDAFRMEFYGDAEWRPGDPPRPTVAPEAFLDWMEREESKTFAVAGRVVARRLRGRVVFDSAPAWTDPSGRVHAGVRRPSAALAEFRARFRDAVEDARRWRRESWIESDPV